jgi:hypothetical protein
MILKHPNLPPPRPIRLTPVQELYLDILKYKFDIISVERRGNEVIVKTQLNPSYEFAHHLLVPKL